MKTLHTNIHAVSEWMETRDHATPLTRIETVIERIDKRPNKRGAHRRTITTAEGETLDVLGHSRAWDVAQEGGAGRAEITITVHGLVSEIRWRDAEQVTAQTALFVTAVETLTEAHGGTLDHEDPEDFGVAHMVIRRPDGIALAFMELCDAPKTDDTRTVCGWEVDLWHAAKGRGESVGRFGPCDRQLWQAVGEFMAHPAWGEDRD